jgi:hypothetical protein
MKRGLLLASVLVMIWSAAFAQAPPKGYIGLYTSTAHDAWCVTGSMPFYSTTMWILCLPSVDGMLCAEFAIQYPTSGMITSTVTPNDAIISVALGDLATGMSVCYQECQWDWNWCFNQMLFITAPDPMHVQIIKHSLATIHYIQFAECIPPQYPVEEVTKYTNFYINYDPITAPECQQTAVESSSWGAIKGMFSE